MTICEALTNVLVFLAQNEEYGDDWSEEISVLEDLLSKFHFDDDTDEYAIYRKVKHEFYVEDAKAQVEYYLDGNITSDLDTYMNDFDYEYLADVFADEKDCEVADNDKWQAIITDYVMNDLGTGMTQLREELGFEN